MSRELLPSIRANMAFILTRHRVRLRYSAREVIDMGCDGGNFVEVIRFFPL